MKFIVQTINSFKELLLVLALGFKHENYIC